MAPSATSALSSGRCRVFALDVFSAIGLRLHRSYTPCEWEDNQFAADARLQPTLTRDMGVCYHPAARVPAANKGAAWVSAHGRALADSDPAIPHIRTQRALRLVLRNAFALGQQSRRAVILPHFWCFCMRHWWYLDGCVANWHDAATRPLPFQCPMDHNFDVFDLITAGLEFREPQFLSSPRVTWAVRDSGAEVRLRASSRAA